MTSKDEKNTRDLAEDMFAMLRGFNATGVASIFTLMVGFNAENGVMEVDNDTRV